MEHYYILIDNIGCKYPKREYRPVVGWSGRYRYAGSIPAIPTKYTNTLLGIIRGRNDLVVADKRNSAINPKGSVTLLLSKQLKIWDNHSGEMVDAGDVSLW